MNKIFIPSRSAADWKSLLAQPDRHWKPGFSAMSLAQCWEDAGGALPSEVSALLATGRHPALEEPELLLAIPEYPVDLPGGERPTQTDVFALVRGRVGLAALAVEGKVNEEFGPTVEAKQREGAAHRLAYLHDLLRILPSCSARLRYQLLHRTAAAILLARRFFAPVAVLVVHSSSADHRWYSDFEAFAAALGVQTTRGSLAAVGVRGEVQLFIGWASGQQRFREDLSQAAV